MSAGISMHYLNLKISEPFFCSRRQEKPEGVFIAWAILLFIVGGLFWGYFIGWGQATYLDSHDWAEITVPRLSFLQNTIRQGVLPLHISGKAALNNVTDRFLTIPDLLLSPQVLLLGVMPVSQFVLFNLLLSYTVGFAGLVWICQRYSLSAFSLTVLFLLFNFNGHLLAHISVGHFTWTGFFLFPWLVGLTLRLFEPDSVDWRWVFRVCVLTLMMLLQGGYHQFIWALFFLTMLALVSGRHWPWLIGAVVFSVLLSAFRTVPAVLNLGQFENNYFLGFPGLYTIFESMVTSYFPNEVILNGDLANHTGVWEVSTYVGLAGLVFLVVFGVIRVFRSRFEDLSYVPLLIPIIGLTLLSLDRVYFYLRKVLPIPIFTGERVASRIVSLALVILMVLSVIEWQKWFNRQAQPVVLRLASLGFLGIMAHDLWNNSRLWTVKYARNLLDRPVMDPSNWQIVNYPDPAYFTVLWIGVGISVLSLLGLILLSIKSKRVR